MQLLLEEEAAVCGHRLTADMTKYGKPMVVVDIEQVRGVINYDPTAFTVLA